jgi:cobalt-zinc-cadmium resistance protein CzcA
VELDRAAARYGINAADVADLISTGIGGAPVGQVYVGEKSYDIAVRFPPAVRSSPDAVANLMLTAANGAKCRWRRWPASVPPRAKA